MTLLPYRSQFLIAIGVMLCHTRENAALMKVIECAASGNSPDDADLEIMLEKNRVLCKLNSGDSV